MLESVVLKYSYTNVYISKQFQLNIFMIIQLEYRLYMVSPYLMYPFLVEPPNLAPSIEIMARCYTMLFAMETTKNNYRQYNNL